MTFYRGLYYGLYYGSLFSACFWLWLAVVALAIRWEGAL